MFSKKEKPHIERVKTASKELFNIIKAANSLQNPIKIKSKSVLNVNLQIPFQLFKLKSPSSKQKHVHICISQ